MNAVGPDVSSGGGTTTDSRGVTVSNDFSSGPPPELKGNDKNSMLRPKEFAKALAIIEKEGGGPAPGCSTSGSPRAASTCRSTATAR